MQSPLAMSQAPSFFAIQERDQGMGARELSTDCVRVRVARIVARRVRVQRYGWQWRGGERRRRKR